jgi:hypothetical protein
VITEIDAGGGGVSLGSVVTTLALLRDAENLPLFWGYPLVLGGISTHLSFKVWRVSAWWSSSCSRFSSDDDRIAVFCFLDSSALC